MRRPFHEFYESIAAGKWQRLQQDRVDNAIDSGRCTNADRESEDGGKWTQDCGRASGSRR